MRVLIAGGGVAGTTTALALRAAGAEVTVVEAYAEPGGDVGGFVSLATNGLRALDSLGVLDAVDAAGFEVDRQRLWGGRGRLLGDMPRARLAEEQMRSRTVKRGLLVAGLRERALAAGVEIITGERLADAVEDGQGVTAVFGGGRRARADLLVGADGIWSAARGILDPAAPRPEYAGTYTVFGTAEVPGFAAGDMEMAFDAAGAFFAVSPGNGVVWWSAQVVAQDVPDLSAVTLDELRGRYSEPLPSRVLAGAEEISSTTLHHMLGEVRRIRGGRIVLVGDAAHPVGAGQGASMAIEDAVALAEALTGAGGDVPRALAAYEDARRPRIARILKMAGDNRRAKVAGPFARRLRDLALPVLIRVFAKRGSAWMYRHDVRGEVRRVLAA